MMNWHLRLFSSEASPKVPCGCRNMTHQGDDVDRFWAELSRAWGRKMKHSVRPALHRLGGAPVMPIQRLPPKTLEIQEANAIVKEWSRCSIRSKRNATLLCSDARSAFERWCRASGKEPCNANTFGRQMTDLGFKRKRKGGQFFYSGIVLTVGLKAVA